MLHFIKQLAIDTQVRTVEYLVFMRINIDMTYLIQYCILLNMVTAIYPIPSRYRTPSRIQTKPELIKTLDVLKQNISETRTEGGRRLFKRSINEEEISPVPTNEDAETNLKGEYSHIKECANVYSDIVKNASNDLFQFTFKQKIVYKYLLQNTLNNINDNSPYFLTDLVFTFTQIEKLKDDIELFLMLMKLEFLSQEKEVCEDIQRNQALTFVDEDYV